MEDIFSTLNAINVNEYTETKDTGKCKLTYLSWSWAWQEFRKRCPDASYEIERFDGKPYLEDEFGIMVFTKVTTNNQTYEMWLPVMDGSNNAMKKEPYSYTTKYGKEVTVSAATMFDINKTIMRCLVKNLAMFGLGLYIYAGEDLPEDAKIEEAKKKEPIGDFRAKALENQLKEWGIRTEYVFLMLKSTVNTLSAVTEEQMSWINKYHEKIKSSQDEYDAKKGEKNENKETAVTK